MASAGDDGAIIVWNVAAGKQLYQLTGHTRQVTCLLTLDRHTLVSGSADKTIRVWSLDTGTCDHVISNAHSASIKCLAKLDSEEGPPMFCSGGNDNKLCIWKSGTQQTQLLGCIERQEDEIVYNTDTLKFDKLLAYHRESVQCLFNISDKLFVSGSLDGSIVLWQSETLTPLRVLEFPEKYFEDHSYISPVNHFALLSSRYLCAAIGRGFRVYDVAKGDCVIECNEGHEAPVLRLVPLYKGSRLVSCSADSSIKIWEIPTGARSKSQGGNPSRRRQRQPAHPRPVVILWKDGNVQSELRNQAASAWIMHQSLREEEESAKEETRHSSFNDLRHLLLARRNFMQQTVDLSDQAEQEEEEDMIAQREMTWPYSFSNKRPNISLEVESRPVAPPNKWSPEATLRPRKGPGDQNVLTLPAEVRVSRSRSRSELVPLKPSLGGTAEKDGRRNLPSMQAAIMLP
ncbi:WD repeatcontaining protein [Acanthamoeba castellanii str. Neff]|uniref:WD repeatcontaining protein n=1 Tax=Acanthamoeba castellanii (strain ATCC 30010 / Neff) TaxID=1257118 RepID=L8HEU1_ACACF|nr:WD repeatcontaining protein [Acanthamoeba castellanii str. Neff]ELR23288.1 WD repeatcontaining protein [Acanthamoeba castellanii str. Neff]